MRPYLLGGVIGALTVAVIALGFIAFSESDSDDSDGSKDEIEVPDVIGLEPEVALSEIEAVGLTVRVERLPCSDGELNAQILNRPLCTEQRVIRQVPDAGEDAPTSATVTLNAE